MAGEKVWTTTRYGTVDEDAGTEILADGPGTVLAIYGTLDYSIANPSLSVWEWFGWVINVGTTSADATASGVDDESVMLRGTGFAPSSGGSGIWSVPHTIDLRTQGRRVLTASDSVWFAAERLDLTTLWSWMLTCRVLIELPEV